MNDWGELNPAWCVIAGDWHGNSFHAVRAIKWAKEHGADVIVHVGDFAFKFEAKFMARVQRALEQTGLILGFVDGNHDDHSQLAALVEQHGRVPIPIRPNIFYLPRCYRWTWSGVKFLAMGGAVSVDRQWRTPGVEWWAGETITWQQAQRACDDGPADVIIAHDVPAGVDIPGIAGNPLGFPAQEIDASERHRHLLRQIVDQVTPRHLYAGHYHVRHIDLLRGNSYQTRVTILAADEAPLADNLAIVDLEQLL